METKNAAALTVKLSAAGNPDFDQPRNIGIKTVIAPVASVEEASRMCLRFIAHHDLGGGNWTGGEIKKDGEVIGRISYNGRAWAVDGSEIKF